MRELITWMDNEIHRLRWFTAFTNFETAVRRYSLALKYRPDQLRIPAGNPDGGQWTHEGGDARLWLASGMVPRVPKRGPPTTREQNQIARGLAREAGPSGLAAAIATGAIWLKEYVAVYAASFDPPKTLAELQDAASYPRPGRDIHHIVERHTAAVDGSEDRLIDAPENKVRIPRWKHWELNGWYEKQNDDYGGMTPRAYAYGKSWEVRDSVGLQGLIAVGVLKR